MVKKKYNKAYALIYILFLLSFCTGFSSGSGFDSEDTVTREFFDGQLIAKAENLGVDTEVGDLPVFPSPENVGTIVFKPEDPSVKPVYFRHLFHRAKFVCKVCHLEVGFPLSIKDITITQKEIEDGKWCGACHDGKIAFGVSECDKCHYVGTEAEEAANTRAKEFAESLPKALSGGWINWVKALDEGFTTPKTYLKKDSELKFLDLDIEFEVSLGGWPRVVFPHAVHTKRLACENCHPGIFIPKKGANKFTMVENFNGKFCGTCHQKVSFPFDDCFRCHSKGG